MVVESKGIRRHCRAHLLPAGCRLLPMSDDSNPQADEQASCMPRLSCESIGRAFRMTRSFQDETSRHGTGSVFRRIARPASGSLFAIVNDMTTQSIVHSERRVPLSSRPRAMATLLRRIQSEYREMPGLKLTEEQVRRLWDIDGHTCRLVLTTLLDQRFLKRTRNGTYVRGD